MKGYYETYTCKYKGDVVYIGQGRKGRHKHCNSGTSHVYELNKIHFLEGEDALQVEVVKTNPSEKLSKEFEKGMIQKYRPKFNKVYLNNKDREDNVIKSNAIRKDVKDFITSDRKYRKVDRKEYYALVKEFIDHFGYNLLNEDFVIHSNMLYQEMGLTELAKFARYIRVKPITTGEYYNKHRVLIDCFEKLYGIDLRERRTTHQSLGTYS